MKKKKKKMMITQEWKVIVLAFKHLILLYYGH